MGLGDVEESRERAVGRDAGGRGGVMGPGL